MASLMWARTRCWRGVRPVASGGPSGSSLTLPRAVPNGAGPSANRWPWRHGSPEPARVQTSVRTACLGAGHQDGAVREVRRIDDVGGARDVDLLAEAPGLRVPQSHGAVVPPAEHGAAVRRPGQPVHAVAMLGARWADRSSRPGVEHLDRPPCAQGEVAPVGGQCEGRGGGVDRARGQHPSALPVDQRPPVISDALSAPQLATAREHGGGRALRRGQAAGRPGERQLGAAAVEGVCVQHHQVPVGAQHQQPRTVVAVRHPGDQSLVGRGDPAVCGHGAGGVEDTEHGTLPGGEPRSVGAPRVRHARGRPVPEQPGPLPGDEVEDPLPEAVFVEGQVPAVGREQDLSARERRVARIEPGHQAAVPAQVEGLDGVVHVDGVERRAVGGVADVRRRLGGHVLDVPIRAQVPATTTLRRGCSLRPGRWSTGDRARTRPYVRSVDVGVRRRLDVVGRIDLGSRDALRDAPGRPVARLDPVGRRAAARSPTGAGPSDRDRRRRDRSTAATCGATPACVRAAWRRRLRLGHARGRPAVRRPGPRQGAVRRPRRRRAGLRGRARVARLSDLAQDGRADAEDAGVGAVDRVVGRGVRQQPAARSCAGRSSRLPRRRPGQPRCRRSRRSRDPRGNRARTGSPSGPAAMRRSRRSRSTGRSCGPTRS